MYEILKDRFKNIYIGELTRNVTDWMWRQNKSSEISLSGSIKQVDDSTDNWERQYRRENRFSEEENKYSLGYVWFERIFICTSTHWTPQQSCWAHSVLRLHRWASRGAAELRTWWGAGAEGAGVGMLPSGSQPHLHPISKALPCRSLSSERLQPPLIGVIDFFVPNPFLAVLIEKLKVINLFF